MYRRGFVALVLSALTIFVMAVPSTASKANGWCNKPSHPHYDPVLCETTTTSTTTSTTVAPTTTTTIAPTTTQAPTTTTTVLPTTTTLPPTTTTTALPSGCSGVQVLAGSNLVTVANAHGAGTTFCLAAGTYVVPSGIPAEAGDKFIGAPSRGSILTGNNSTTIAFATSSGPNVTLQNLVIERFASPLQQGAIGGPRPRPATDTGWVVDNCEFRFNNGIAIMANSGWQITNSFIHHQGQLGVAGQGLGILYENNEISFNNTANHDSGWEAGASKFVNTDGLIVRDNYVHDNNGQGLWTDINNIRTLYENNRVINNKDQGIFHEISYDAVIRNNEVRDNGHDPAWLYGAGIVVAASSNVEVYGNILSGNGNGIALIQQPRGSGTFGPWEVRNVWVHDNDITMTSGLTGAVQDTGDNAIFTDRNNRFTNNDYHGVVGRNAWAWMNSTRSWTEWQGFGQDLTGSID